ncbi:HNH endonuclease [Amycolatopsis sp. NPDC003861]
MIYNLRKPTRDYVHDYDFALSKAGSPAVDALVEVRDEVLDAYRVYDLLEGNPGSVIPLEISEEAKKALHDNFKFTQKRRLLSVLRDEAMELTYKGLCPMCCSAQVKDLDHYLPRSLYPEFSLLSLNLVPICSRCNGTKRSKIGTVGERFVHAFYDDLPEDRPALRVDLSFESRGIRADFSVNPALPGDLFKLVEYHFNNLELSEHYSVLASQELVERLQALDKTFIDEGSDGVGEFAGDQSDWIRRKFGFHHWKAALYDAVKVDQRFLDGGFRVIS